MKLSLREIIKQVYLPIFIINIRVYQHNIMNEALNITNKCIYNEVINILKKMFPMDLEL